MQMVAERDFPIALVGHTASSIQSRLDELDSRWKMFQEILISNIVCMDAMMLEVGKNLIRLI